VSDDIRLQMDSNPPDGLLGGPAGTCNQANEDVTVSLDAANKTITFLDNDIMSHKLLKTSGPAVRYRPGPAMRHMSASVRVTFGKVGVYRFTTKLGEDYPGMAMKTIGEDNVLRLTVRVTG